MSKTSPWSSPQHHNGPDGFFIGATLTHWKTKTPHRKPVITGCNRMTSWGVSFVVVGLCRDGADGFFDAEHLPIDPLLDEQWINPAWLYGLTTATNDSRGAER